MVGKIFIVLVLTVAALAIAQREHAFQKWGVVGSCDAVRSPSGDTGAWYACREGLLTGYPSLLGDECSYELRSRGYEYWRCAVPRERAASGR